MYSTVTADIAIRIARGTVRAGSLTSPLGTSALSTPAKAKRRKSETRPSFATSRPPDHARFAGETAKTPNTTRHTSGTSLATVPTSTSRAPLDAPRTFTDVKRTNTSTMTATRAKPTPAPGTSAFTACAKALATPACATVPKSQISTPLWNPRNGPKTVPTYAYGPPVIETRLPASAKHSTMSPNATAQTRYATHASDPRRAATTAGARKMPPPTVMFRMLADSERTPRVRSSARSTSPAVE